MMSLSKKSNQKLIPMMIDGVILDPNTQSPIVVLKSLEGKKVLPIWVGVFEASAIVMVLESIEPIRPMTHDLLKTLLDQAGVRVERVVIHSVEENTYYAEIVWRREGSSRDETTDARPSDALALAIRARAPVFVTEKVAETSIVFEDFIKTSEAEKYREFLDNLDPDDFSKYRM